LNNSTLISFICFKEDDQFYKGIKYLSNNSLPYIIFFNSNPKHLEKLNQLNSKYILSNDNVGISKAMNTLMTYAITNKYKHILFFDQDTIFTKDNFNFIKKTEKIFAENKKIAAINVQNKVDDQQNSFIKKLLIINSCTMFHLSRTKKIGFFNENYFVEYADYEFCLRCSIKNYIVGVSKVSNFLDHYSNQGSKKFDLMFFKLDLRIYPQSRVDDLNNAFKLIIKECLENFKIKFFIKIFILSIKWHFKHILSRVILKEL